MQACDVMLEQINAFAALPGRPKLEIPASISREVRIKHCDIPPYVIPQSPFDAALDLSFDTPRIVDQESPDRLELFDSQICSPIVEECSSLDSQPHTTVSLPQSESEFFPSVSQPSHALGPDSGEDTSGYLEKSFNDSEFCNSELKLSHASPLGNTFAPLACISGSQEHVSKCSIGVPENPPQRRPVNFISAAYYVERPSNPQSCSPGSARRRTSFCRIEAFVIRSKSVKPVTPQHRVGVPEVKK